MANEKRNLIDRDDLIDSLGISDMEIFAKEVIGDAPTVYAVEVVRCKDCKSHHWEQEPCHGKTVHICSKLNAEVTRDFYCAAGERKDNGC